MKVLGRGRCQIPPPQATMCPVPGPAGHPDPACPSELARARYCQPWPLPLGHHGWRCPKVDAYVVCGLFSIIGPLHFVGMRFGEDPRANIIKTRV